MFGNRQTKRCNNRSWTKKVGQGQESFLVIGVALDTKQTFKAKKETKITRKNRHRFEQLGKYDSAQNEECVKSGEDQPPTSNEQNCRALSRQTSNFNAGIFAKPFSEKENISWQERIALLGSYAGLGSVDHLARATREVTAVDRAKVNAISCSVDKKSREWTKVCKPLTIQPRYPIASSSKSSDTAFSRRVSSLGERFTKNKLAREDEHLLIRVRITSASKCLVTESSEKSSEMSANIQDIRLQVVSPEINKTFNVKNIRSASNPSLLAPRTLNSVSPQNRGRASMQNNRLSPYLLAPQEDDHFHLPVIGTTASPTLGKGGPAAGKFNDIKTRQKKSKGAMPRVGRKIGQQTRLLNSASRKQLVGVMPDDRTRLANRDEKTKAPLFPPTKSNQNFKAEVYRLERARDDLIRRNQFLQKEILYEQEDCKAVETTIKIEELVARNSELLKVHDAAHAKELVAKKHLMLSENIQQQAMSNNSEATKHLKASQKTLNDATKDLERVFGERKRMDENVQTTDDKITEHEKDLKDINNEIQEHTLQRTHKEEEHEKAMKHLNANKQYLVEDEFEIRGKASRNSKAKDALAAIRNTRSDIQLALEKVKRHADVQAKEENNLRSELNGISEQSEHTTLILAEAQRRFRKREELRINSKSKGCQTDGRLVLLRDIAWIRVANEEVILSPHTGTAKHKSFKGDSASTTNDFPLGFCTPVFEVYDVGIPSENDSMMSQGSSSTSRRTLPTNKCLIDDCVGNEFVWTSDNN